MRKLFVALSMLAFLAACEDSTSASSENNESVELGGDEELVSSSSSKPNSGKKVSSSSSVKSSKSSSSSEKSSSSVEPKSSSSEKKSESSSSVKSSKSSCSSEKSSSSAVPKSSSSEKKLESSSSVNPNCHWTKVFSDYSILECWSWDAPKEIYFNPDIDYGFLTDERDGKVYRTVKIGEQTWMAENLNYADSIKTPSLKRRNFCFNDEPKNCDVGGRFYTWAAAMDSVNTGCGIYSRCDAGHWTMQGICPDGWHLPDLYEWKDLFTTVGGDSIAGAVLKSRDSWDNLSHKSTDVFGFSAVPAGYSTGYSSDYDGIFAYFWINESSCDTKASYAYLSFKDKKAFLAEGDQRYGYSVRCVKN